MRYKGRKKMIQIRFDEEHDNWMIGDEVADTEEIEDMNYLTCTGHIDTENIRKITYRNHSYIYFGTECTRTMNLVRIHRIV